MPADAGHDDGIGVFAGGTDPAASAVRRSWATLRRPASPARPMARSVSPNRMRVTT